LRKVCGPVNGQGLWGIGTNRELYKPLDPVAGMERSRLNWFGHVIRMNQTRLGNEMFERKPGDTREVGRAQTKMPRRCRE
jgi:hypothetical protein